MHIRTANPAHSPWNGYNFQQQTGRRVGTLGDLGTLPPCMGDDAASWDKSGSSSGTESHPTVGHPAARLPGTGLRTLSRGVCTAGPRMLLRAAALTQPTECKHTAASYPHKPQHSFDVSSGEQPTGSWAPRAGPTPHAPHPTPLPRGTHFPLAECLAVTLSSSFLPVLRSCLPSMEPVCTAFSGSQKVICEFSVATASSAPSGRKVTARAGKRCRIRS